MIAALQEEFNDDMYQADYGEEMNLADGEKFRLALDYYPEALKDGTVIGAVNLRVDNAADSLEFNYAVDSRHRNHGYMTEALNLVKDYAVNTLKARRFCGGCAVSNTASRRVMEKCGLTYERTLASCLELKDGLHDMMVYSYVSSKGSIKEIPCSSLPIGMRRTV